MRPAVALPLAALVVTAVACGQRPTTAPATTAPTTTAPTGPSRTLRDPLVRATPAPTATPLPSFASRVGTVTAAQLGATWHAGCPVAPSQLRLLSLTFYGFDATAHTGQLVVNAVYAGTVTAAFADLYAHRFPIRTMITVDRFGGSDERSVAADNTAGFNCRAAVGGDGSWSMHAYGEAIDVDPVENPYVYGGTVDPPAGAAYTDRGAIRPGMAYRGGELVGAFARIGWAWGATFRDYQHFSTNGR